MIKIKFINSILPNLLNMLVVGGDQNVDTSAVKIIYVLTKFNDRKSMTKLSKYDSLILKIAI